MLLMYKSCAKLLVLLLIFLTTATASGGSNAYGNEPWLFFGDPIAPSSAIVHSALGSARFTILTPRLIRIEGPPPFEDARTLVVWNRNLSVPSYTTNTTGMTTTIDTGAFGVLLTYIDDGSGSFTSSNLQIQRRTPSFWSNVSDSWTPSLQPGVDDGQLFGTFHTLDDGLNGFVGLNCSLLDPNNDSEGAADFYPCDFGLLSKRGFFLFDDSNSPVWDETLGWLKTQDKAICAANESLTGTHCFAGSTQDTTDPLLCHAAGCCLAGGKNSETLSLWYSSQRDDHFSDNHNCTDGCGSYGYAYLHEQGTYSTFSDIGYVPLNLYWNQNPRDGAGGDNVASSFAPTEPGYTFARNMGYVYDPSLPQPKATVPLKVFYSATHLDHWTTASDADEQQAISLGYTMIGLAGYITPPSSGPAPPAPPFNCYRPTHHTDMYLFAHGIEYDSALSDYIAIAGAIPIPRRHWLGVSWSKWNESEIESDSLAHVRLLQQAGFPLDTLIFDMQWHRTPSWGGYSWDPSRYSDHVSMLQTLHSEGLQIGANFHDDDGVQQNDNPERWAAFAQAVGADINSSGVTFNIGNKTYADALQQIIMTPLISEGIDFVWTDFQQGMPGVADIRGLVPTAMINHYRFYNFSVAAGTRGTYHSRYAGRGDHRHSSHFGGDVDQTWESLRFMIYFTATAANAPACWWGHEMMRNGGGINDNSELFTRVNQFGAWSPIFTSWGNVGENNDWWLESEPFLSATRNSLLDRQRLLPYRYTVADVSHRTGRCPIVSMYRSYPTEPLAYSADGQYMLGTDLVVAPAFSPISSQTGTVAVTVWLPPDSLWVDFNSPSATPFLGGSSITYNASISIVPVFVRAGAVIPMLPRKLANVTGISARQYSSLEFNVFPSPETSATGHCEVYEDDGMSTDYLGGISARTTFEYGPSFSSVGCTEYTISTTGTYTNMITDGRLYSVFILSSSSPTSVSVNGINLSQSAVDDIPGTWYFSTEELHVFLPPSSTANAQSLIIC